MNADWVGVEEALERVVSSVQTLGPERCAIREALGRVLADDLVAPVDVPRWTNSAMDGFAVRAADVALASDANPVILPVVDDIGAGAFPKGPLTSGEAARVMTGAPVPEGADSVIRVEHTDGGVDIGSAGGQVTILNGQDAGRNLRRQGEDLRVGAVALLAGDLLTPAGCGVAASLGYSAVEVIRRPRVALLTSGDELVEVEGFEEVRAGRKIVSSNSYTLAAQLADAGCDVVYLGIATDTPHAMRAALAGAVGCDALVTSAGISVGEHDHVKSVLADLGTRVSFWRVRMRPGSPFAFGTVHGLGGIPWFGLPGNPVSSMVTFEAFARPALLKMGGRRAIYRRAIQAVLEEDFNAPAGLVQFIRVRLRQEGSTGWRASLTGAQGSGILTSIARADGLMIVPEDRSGARAGETLPVIPFDPTWLSPESPLHP